LYDAVEAKTPMLADYPRLGPRRPEIRPRVRQLVQGTHLILYEKHPDMDDGPVDEVEIVRVVHGRRNLTRPF
jgi:toxin ParE1/3/4